MAFRSELQRALVRRSPMFLSLLADSRGDWHGGLPEDVLLEEFGNAYLGNGDSQIYHQDSFLSYEDDTEPLRLNAWGSGSIGSKKTLKTNLGLPVCPAWGQQCPRSNLRSFLSLMTWCGRNGVPDWQREIGGADEFEGDGEE